MSKTESKTKRSPEEKAARKAAKEVKKAKELELESQLNEAQPVETNAAPTIVKTKEKKRKRDAEEEIEQVAEPKKSKKSKRSKTSTDAPSNEEAEPQAPVVSQDAPNAASTEQDFMPLESDTHVESGIAAVDAKQSKRAKKGKKSKKTPKSTDTDTAESKDEAATGGDAPLEAPNAETMADAAAAKKGRFIVFVGNLPYTATKDEIQTHFSKIEPTDVRIMTDKQTGKPKGFAFVEFDRFDRMQTCLKKYNHSVFGEGKKGRKINVELTAGGGGNTSARIFKIQSKNEKLHNERERDREKRSELEAKQDERKKKKEHMQKSTKKTGQGTDSKNQSEENGGIHPSRLAMMQQPGQRDWQDHRKPHRY